MQFNFARFTCIYHIYDRNFSLRYPKRSESIGVLGTERKSVMIIRVKVNSKSVLVEDREGKSALYRCNLLFGRQVIVESCNMWSYGLDLRSF